MDTSVVATLSPPSALLNQSINSVGSSNSSSSSASSGYGSATTTPTTPLGSQYDGLHASPTSAATVATVAPFFNEASNADVQLQQQYHHHRQYQQQQQQQQPHYFQNYSSYVSQPNIGTVAPAAASHLDYNTYSNVYTPPNGAVGGYQNAAPTRSYEKLTIPQINTGSSSKSYATQSLQATSTGHGKPQATATPFYAQPLYGSNNMNSGSSGPGTTYYDAYKYKKLATINQATDYGSPYGAYPPSYQSQQPQPQYYVPPSQKPQLTESNYATVRPSTRQHPPAGIAIYGSSSVPFYGAEKYNMYGPSTGGFSNGHTSQPTHLPPTITPASLLGASHYASPELTPESGYRKPNTCHWNGVDYTTANYRSIPPSHASANHSYHHLVPPQSSSQTNPEMYFGKYDKNNANVPTANHFAATQQSSRNLWSGTTSSTPLSSSENALPASVRQNCCNQSIQQNCFYPRNNSAYPPALTSTAYPNTAQYATPQNHITGSNSAGKLKHSNDLYISPTYDSVPTVPGSHMGFNYPTPNNNHRYSSISGGLPSVEATTGAPIFYNDLSNLNPQDTSYTAHQQPLVGQMQHMARATCINTGGKHSLLDYRKPLPSSQTNCYVPQISPLSNLEEHVDGYTASYQLQPEQNSGFYTSSAIAIPNSNHSSRTAAPKNLSIRDFLSSWNDDEEEHALIAPEEPSTLLLHSEQTLLRAPIQLQEIGVMNEAETKLKNTAQNGAPKHHVSVAVADAIADIADTNQYMNLPDIVIDIEKSNNAPSTVLPSSTEDSFGSFDVEKELDELRMQKNSQVNAEHLYIEEPTTKALEEMLGNPIVESTIEKHDPASEQQFSVTQTTEESKNLDENLEKNIIGREDDFSNSSNSNGSSYEQVYESFIKNTNCNSSTNVPVEHCHTQDQNEMVTDDTEYKQHLKKFSKFYKRKRKLTEPSCLETDTSIFKQHNDPENNVENVTRLNKCAKQSRQNAQNRKKFQRWANDLKCLYKKLYRLKLRNYFKSIWAFRRRLALEPIKFKKRELLRLRIAQQKERHLPLIKRQSVKQYSSLNIYNPQTLKRLSVSYVNSDSFRQSLLKPVRTETVIKTVYQVQRAKLIEEAQTGCIDLTVASPLDNSFVVNDDSLEKTDLVVTEKTEEQETTKCPIINSQDKTLDQPTENADRDVDDSDESMNSESPTKISVQSVELMENFKGFEDAESNSEKHMEKIDSPIEAVRTSENQSNEKNNEIGVSSKGHKIFGEIEQNTQKSWSDSSDLIKTHKAQTLNLKKFKDFEIQEWLRKNSTSEEDCAESLKDKATLDNVQKTNEFQTKENLLKIEALLDENSMSALSEVSFSSNSTVNSEASNIGTNKTINNEWESNSSSDSSSSSSTSSSTSSNNSITSSNDSDFNELAALEKELSQHPTNEESAPIAATTSNDISNTTYDHEVSNHDIAHLKKILESDGEDGPPGQEQQQSQLDAETHNPQAIYVDSKNIPKLSDLCKNALNSSLKTNELVLNMDDDTTNDITAAAPLIERELSVEEALAEMYQQIGVVSDHEEFDESDEGNKIIRGEAQDILLINLAEIFDSSSDLYVLQCDMNENILSVVTSDEDINNHHHVVNATGESIETVDSGGIETERVNTLQLFEILNATDVDVVEGEGQVNNDLIVLNNFVNNEELVTAETVHDYESSVIDVCEGDSDGDMALISNENTQFELPPIHHEEIVPDNYKEFEKQKFIKYLHEKYVQTSISKYYHANCILKKYKRRSLRNFRKSNK